MYIPHFRWTKWRYICTQKILASHVWWLPPNNQRPFFNQTRVPSCKKMVDFQIASDLHIELKGGLRASASAFPEPHSELLILAGDVYNAGAPEFPEILRRASEGFQLTLFVPGNHEFYGLSGSFPGIEKMIAERVNSLPNVYCLNNSSITVGGLTFVGATMWTETTKEHWE